MINLPKKAEVDEARDVAIKYWNFKARTYAQFFEPILERNETSELLELKEWIEENGQYRWYSYSSVEPTMYYVDNMFDDTLMEIRIRLKRRGALYD